MNTFYMALVSDNWDLNLEEVTNHMWMGPPPHTWIDTTDPIDGICPSKDLEIGSTIMMSFDEGVGDHQTMVMDVTTRSLIGKYPH